MKHQFYSEVPKIYTQYLTEVRKTPVLAIDRKVVEFEHRMNYFILHLPRLLEQYEKACDIVGTRGAVPDDCNNPDTELHLFFYFFALLRPLWDNSDLFCSENFAFYLMGQFLLKTKQLSVYSHPNYDKEYKRLLLLVCTKQCTLQLVHKFFRLGVRKID